MFENKNAKQSEFKIKNKKKVALKNEENKSTVLKRGQLIHGGQKLLNFHQETSEELNQSGAKPD